MSRAVHLSMTETETRDHCTAKSIGVSVIEPLPDGGVRLVCSSSEGAELIRKRLKSKLIKDAVRRNAHGRARSPIEGWTT